MNPRMPKLLLLGVLAGAFEGCNMMAEFERDVEKPGAKIENKAEQKKTD